MFSLVAAALRKSPDRAVDAEPACALGNRVNLKSRGQPT
jgi:hypothetical protein